MDLFNLFARISIDSSEYESGVKSAKSSNEELKKSTAALGTDFTALQNKIKVLSAQHESASKKVADLKEQFNKSASETGATSEKTQELAKQLDAAEKEAKDLKSKLDSLTSTTEDTGNKFSDLGSKISSAGKFITSGIGVIAGAATAAAGGLLALESATEEYRVAQGKLNTAFEAAGYGADSAKKAYTDFYKILGDVGTATEASQLLAKLADSQEDISTWTNIAAGVYGTFGDSLPIEGLIEASNETSKVGTVTGVLADALNWAGISEDAFNAALAECADESKRNRLIMETLSGTYDDASEAFYRNNDALVESREAQAQMDEALSKIGGSVTTVKNAFLEQFAPAISDASTKIADFISNVDTEKVVSGIQGMISTFQDLLPVITGVTAATLAYKAAVAISSIIETVTKATQGMTIAQAALNAVMNLNPFVLIATLIAGLVTAIITLWATNEDFRNAIINIWDAVKNAFSGAWETVKSLWSTAGDFFSGVWDSIKSAFSSVSETLRGFFSTAFEAIKVVFSPAIGYFQNVWNSIKGIFSAVKSVLSGDFQGAWNAIKGVFSGWKSYFSRLWNTVVSIFSGAYQTFSNIGKSIVNGVWNGITSLGSWLKNKVTNFFGGIVNGVKDFLGIRSPSRVFAGIGGFMAEGVGVGWEDEFPSVKRGIESELDFGNATVGLSTSVRGSKMAGIGGKSVSYGTVNFTINAREGQSAREIAEEVAMLLQMDLERREHAFA